MDTPIEQFLSRYPAEVRQLAEKARLLILTVMPGLVEQPDEPASLLGYGFDRSYKGMVCGIAIFKTYVNIMLAQGAMLPDPERLLSGTGKRARHIRVDGPDDLEAPGVRALLESAYQLKKSELKTGG